MSSRPVDSLPRLGAQPLGEIGAIFVSDRLARISDDVSAILAFAVHEQPAGVHHAMTRGLAACRTQEHRLLRFVVFIGRALDLFQMKIR